MRTASVIKAGPALDAVRAGELEALPASSADARAAAVAAGYEEGRQRAAVELEQERQALRRRADEELRRALGALEAAHDELAARFRQATRDLEDAVASLVVDIARAVLRREVACGADALARALSLAGDRPGAIVRLNPADLPTEASVHSGLELRADASVAPGGFELEVGETLVDGRIETALERVRAVLEGAR
ncbi:MAG TPA: FliH/SctL family protein [Acidimicrobiales bacterium]|nr:FliH/SctL family protein [Acidimicrobiales bacterium]